MNNNKVTIFFIKCTQIVYTCLMLLAVSCGKLNNINNIKRKYDQSHQVNGLPIDLSQKKPKTINFDMRSNRLGNSNSILRQYSYNDVDNKGWTLLHHMVNMTNMASGDLEKLINSFFLEFQCPDMMFKKDYQGNTPVLLAKKNTNQHTYNLLLKHLNSALRELIKKGEIAPFQKVLSLIQRLNANDPSITTDIVNYSDESKGNTLLHLAAISNQEEFVKVLLDNGANIWTKNKDDMRAIDLATDPNIKNLLETHFSTLLKRIKGAV